MQITALLAVAFVVLLVRPHLVRALGTPNGMTGAGIPGDPYIITTCQNLQDIELNLDGKYQLANDIDCSGSSSWNSGRGFIPVGASTEFTGTVNGYGHNINNLTINGGGYGGAGTDVFVALFAQTANAHLLNFKVTNATVIGNESSNDLNGRTAGIAALMNGGIISQVSFNGSISMPACGNPQKIGGLVGSFGDGTIQYSSTSGSISVSGTDCGGLEYTAGGLVGVSYAGTVHNSYSNTDITFNAQASATCAQHTCSAIGGLVGALNENGLIIEDAYASGALSVLSAPSEWLTYAVGGLVGSTVHPQLDPRSSFVATPITVPAPCAIEVCGDRTRKASAIIGSSLTSFAVSLYYDQTRVGVTHCMDQSPANDASCTALNTDGLNPGVFKGAATTPIDTWDTTTVWQISPSNYPTFRLLDLTPTPVQNLVASIASKTSVNLAWDDPGYAVNSYYTYCKKSSEITWLICNSNSGNGNFVNVTGLEEATEYDFRVFADTQTGYDSAPAEVSGRTGRPGFNYISSCQELQNINNDMSANYELTRDIDCSDSITWNNGAGFDPIGYMSFDSNSNAQVFTGILAGNNYAIQNLYIDQSNAESPTTLAGLFSGTYQALIQDVTLANPVITGGYVTGAVVGYGANTTITNVHVVQATIQNGVGLGGLAGFLTTEGNESFIHSKNSVTGSLSTPQAIYVGGLYGIADLGGEANNFELSNSYANVDITSDTALVVGGLTGAMQCRNNTTCEISNSYAAGSIHTTGEAITDSEMPAARGGIAGTVYSASEAILNIEGSFASVEHANLEPSYIIGGISGTQWTGQNSAIAVNNNSFDADQAGTSTCSSEYDGSPYDRTCLAISGQPDYFKNNSANPPLNSWDFTNIWQVTSQFPVFSARVTSTITAISAERLNRPPIDGTTTPTVPPAVASSASAESIAKLASGVSGKTLSGPTDEAGILGAIKHFVRSLPAGVVIAFPYALFSLLFVATLILLIELYRELRRIQELQILLRKQRLLAEERDAFWHLAANYLRAPVTLIVGGAEALRESQVGDSTSAIATLASSLQTKVANIMAKIEGSTSLQAISQVQPRQTAKLAGRAIFIIPVVTVAFLAILGNYAAASYRDLGPTALGYATQLVGFVIAAVLFYWVLGLFTRGKSKRQAAEAQLNRQTGELANARHELINDTAHSLNPDLTKLEGQLAILPAATATAAVGAITTLRDGTSRLREIVSSFTLLIKVQEGTGAGNASSGAVDLTGILGKVRAKLTPQIAAKNVRVMAPSGPLDVHAEADLANQVIESILANAVDYSPAGGTVQIETKKLQDAIQVRISDQGQGINKQQLDHLFQPFVRADGKSAMDMSHGGFGINLYLDKLIMEQMGGSISAVSTPGKGTAITMSWPT